MAQRRKKASSKPRSQSSRQREEILRQLLTRERALRKQALAREKEALDRQAATSDILKVISGSPADVAPVFDAIAERARVLCGASLGYTTRFDGKLLHLVGYRGVSARAEAVMREMFPRPLDRGSVNGRAILAGEPVQIVNVRLDPEYQLREQAKAAEFRSMLAVPMMRAGEPIGAVGVARKDPGAFSDRLVSLLKIFAAQAVIAIENVRLFKELQARNRELTESLEQQTATGEILRVISSSPTDLAPVFDAVAKSVSWLCDAPDVVIARADGEVMRFGASVGPFGQTFGPDLAIPIRRGSVAGRAVLERRTIHIHDLAAEPDDEYPEGKALQRRYGHRTIVATPLLLGDTALGAIAMLRQEVRPFSTKQLALVRTFADQAVIAIENARLFNETREALERQTATGEILASMSGSMTDTKPVFEAIVRSLLRLFGTSYAVVALRRGEVFELAGFQGEPGFEHLREHYPVPVDEHTMLGEAVIARQVKRYAPIAGNPAVPRLTAEIAQRFRFNSSLAAPMMWKGEAIGVVMTARTQALPFDDTQVALIKAFADQAVIAIENARLFNETKEALEQQTATAEILRVISGSPTDTQPVFDAIAKSGVRLFQGVSVSVRLAKGNRNERVAFAAGPGSGVTDDSSGSSIPLKDELISSRSMLRREVVHVPDIMSEPWIGEESKSMAERMGYRAVAVAPMVRDGDVLGIIGVTRAQAGPFKERDLALLKTFADQAVIAIQNVQLFNETKEALERQTATSEILRVISSSPTNVQPVFDAIARSAVTLCGGTTSCVFRYDSQVAHFAAHYGFSPEALEIMQRRYPRVPQGLIAPTLLQSAIIVSADVLSDGRSANPQLHRALGVRGWLAVPMLLDGRPIGAISVWRREPGPFTDSQIALLRTFADQAVIAIENVRLFNETKEALEQQKASADVLSVISGSIADTTPVFEKILDSCERLFEGHLVGITVVRPDGMIDRAAYRGPHEEEIRSMFPMPLSRDSASGNAILDAKVVHYPDIEEPGVPVGAVERFRMAGTRAIICAPMLFEGQGVGAIWVGRKFAAAFTDKQIALLRTFADQAAIAIQNAKLFREIQEKSKQLEVASEHKSHFLASMSHELRTPLNAILGFNEMLLDQVYGELSEDVKAPLENMQASGKHLLRLINNVLDLAKIEAGRMELALADYSVQDTVESVRSTLRPLAESKGLELVATVPQDLPLAYGDAGRITQCLMNLAGNSLKFTKEGRVEISVQQQNGQLRYRVADTGIGIPPDKIGSLFTEFKQTDATIASEYGGTGLGLSITKKFIEMHGGRIWVESEPGTGSTFTFELPLLAGEGKAA